MRAGRVGVPQSVFDVATDAGLGWKPGRLRRLLKELVAKHAAVPKAKAFRCARARAMHTRTCTALTRHLRTRAGTRAPPSARRGWR